VALHIQSNIAALTGVSASGRKQPFDSLYFNHLNDRFGEKRPFVQRRLKNRLRVAILRVGSNNSARTSIRLITDKMQSVQNRSEGG